MRRALERIYTLVGKEYGLLVVAVNPEANAAARELVLAARSISTEVAAKAGVRQVIKGPVLRYDLTGKSVEFKKKDMESALGGRTLQPIVIAFVGVSKDTVTRLSDGTCVEKEDLGVAGYLVLNFDTAEVSTLDLCQPAVKKPRSSATPVVEAKFLVGSEAIDDTYTLDYAIRVTASKPTPVPEVTRSTAPPVKAFRATRWQQPAPRKEPQNWEKMIQVAVKLQLEKLMESAKDLGDGLVLRVWPKLIENIAEAREWRTVFTHQSVDPTPRANYEAFETMGDKVLSLVLVHYLFSKGEGPSQIMDSNGLTDSHKEILSFGRQSIMAFTMGLNQEGLIRSSVVIDDKMLEDVYEAFFGCLFTLGNRFTEGGNQGLSICEALFKHVLHESFPELNPWSVPKDPQTTLDQIFIRMQWGHPALTYNEDTRITTIKLTQEAVSFLNSIGPLVRTDKVLAVGPSSADKQASARAAADLALTTLKLSWGIDSKYASIMVRNRLMKDQRYAIVHQEALKIAEKMGFSDIYVTRKAKNHNQLYAVIGVKPNDTESQLHVYKYENTGAEDESGGLSTRVAAYITALRGFIKVAA
jgi:dsRNA-specific ribonuclease